MEKMKTYKGFNKDMTCRGYQYEEIKRVSAKGFLLTAMAEDGIRKLVMVDGVSGLEIALLTNANERLIDEIWKDCGIESRALREATCKKAEQIKSFIEEEAVKE